MDQSTTKTKELADDLALVISAEFLARLQRAGVIEARIFGSVARGDVRPESDIDLLVTFDQKTSLFRQIELADELSEVAGRKVHLMTRIKPEFESFIKPTLVRLPL